MREAERFEFPEDRPGTTLPFLPLTLRGPGQALTVRGLLDTGSTVNVLPYDMGLSLGAVWERASTNVRLTGNLKDLEARALAVQATVGGFAPVELVLAWTRAREVPLILGQMNFFLEFDVCFYRSAGYFEVRPKQSP